MLRRLCAVLASTVVGLALVGAVAPLARADEAASGDAAKAGEEEPAEEEPAEEEETDELAYDRDGWYAGIGAGYVIENFQGGSANDTGFVNIRGGYRFLQYGAAEVQLEYTPKFNGQSGRYAGTNTGLFGTWANFKGYPTAPWTGPVQPYAMIGIGWWWARHWGSAVSGVEHDGDFVSRFGGGVDFYFTRNVVVTLEGAYVVPTGDLRRLDQVQIGGVFQYRFDP